jgi:hypothetical protein
MATVAVNLAAAVARQIAASGLVPPALVRRAYRIERNAATMADGMHVTVLPATRDGEVGNRQRDSRNEYTITVVLQAKLGPVESETEQVDQLLEIAEDVANALTSTPITDSTINAERIGNDAQELFDPDDLELQRIFTSVLRLTYEAWWQAAPIGGAA